MKLTITMELDNAAFGETTGERGEAVNRALVELANYVADVGLGVGSGRWIKDVNGNTVGRLEVS